MELIWRLKEVLVAAPALRKVVYGKKLMELLKQKVEMGILEPSSAPYSNRWFTVPKKNGTLCFI